MLEFLVITGAYIHDHYYFKRKDREQKWAEMDWKPPSKKPRSWETDKHIFFPIVIPFAIILGLILKFG